MKTDSLYRRLPDLLLPWYLQNARVLPWRADREPYHVWLSEIMLQQTRVEAVIDYYNRFLSALPDIAQLAACEEETLLKLWEGLGYYSRVRNLQKAAVEIMEKHGGVFPNTYAGILALPGVGPYTAGAIASICFELPCPAVDGNVLRVITRITEDFSPIDAPKTKKEIAKQLESVYPKGSCGDFTQALMELGACVCTPKSPKCGTCPVRDLCKAKAHQTIEQLPVKEKKMQQRVEERTVFLLQCDDKFAIAKREDKGLLAGLWQLPNVLGKLTAEQAIDMAGTFGVRPAGIIKETHKEHVFTHIRWQMTCYHLQCAVQAKNYQWATLQQLESVYALPTAFRIFL